MTPLTNQNLVEAVTRLRKLLTNNPDAKIMTTCTGANMEIGGAMEAVDIALKEASAPRKEFPPGSGMDRGSWFTLEYTLEAQNKNGYYSHMIAACRMIAEALE